MIGRTAKCRSLLRPLPSAWASFSLARTGPVLLRANTLFMECEWTLKTHPHCCKQNGRVIFDLEAKKYRMVGNCQSYSNIDNVIQAVNADIRADLQRTA